MPRQIEKAGWQRPPQSPQPAKRRNAMRASCYRLAFPLPYVGQDAQYKRGGCITSAPRTALAPQGTRCRPFKPVTVNKLSKTMPGNNSRCGRSLIIFPQACNFQLYIPKSEIPLLPTSSMCYVHGRCCSYGRGTSYGHQKRFLRDFPDTAFAGRFSPVLPSSPRGSFSFSFCAGVTR